MKQKTGFSVSALTLSVVTMTLAGGGKSAVSARSAVLLGALQAALLTVLVRWAGTFWHQKKDLPRRTAALALALWFLAELMHAFAQAQWVAKQEFHSMALVGILPLLLWAGCKIPPAGWNAPARVLWWFAFLGGAGCLLGIAGQMSWPRLMLEEAGQQPEAYLCAEYFAWPLLCPQDAPCRAARLPWAAYAVQAGTVLGMQLVFGVAGYPALELLRAWNVGVFSRMDALLLLIWLACAIYRISFLCGALRVCLQTAVGTGKELEEQ